MVKIRKLREKDIKTIIKVMKEFPDAYPAYYVNSRKRGGIRWLLQYTFSNDDKFNARSFVLGIDNKIVGHITYWKDVRSFEGMVYELRALVIDKKYESKGYGAQLIKYAEKELKKINARIIWLQTNKKEVSYYKKLGYRLIAIYKNYWGANRHRYVMGYRLCS